ncbi:MAG: beta-ketoacyl synthase N-terminal-like domain-containing protein, partial [Planctomycetaceae bacterium]|nr:beta-ketoacyl synthase N-terminal-like domain-containing protein [Planctomycetaceae bacterium]
NLGGTAHCVDGACASGLIAIEQGLDRLRLGKADLVVAGGFFLTQTQIFMHVFTRIGAVSRSGMIRPMDRRADGLLIGEGAGAVLLKRLEDAIADGDHVYAIIKGAGSASDGRDVDVLAPSMQGQLRALGQAYQDANVDPASIGYLELHGTGTVLGDLTELESVKTFYGRSKHPPTSRAMGTVKSIIGHCMPASGMAAVIRTALALSNKVLPPSLHCEEPRPELVDSPFYINTTTRPWVQNEARGPRRAGVNSFGFGGINGHLILEEVVAPSKTRRKTKAIAPRPIEPAVDRPSELAVFAAASPQALLQQFAQLQAFLVQDQGEKTAADVAAALAQRVDAEQPCKLAIIFQTLEELTAKLERLAPVLSGETTTTTNGAGSGSAQLLGDEQIYYSENAAQPPGKIAFLFPGMGFPGLIGNYPDHVLELCLHYPELRQEFDYFEERDRHPDDDIPTSSVFVPPASLPEGYRQKLKGRLAPPKSETEATNTPPPPEERYLAAMGVTLVNWISWTLLEQFQVPVDMMTGQSQGEMAALCAAGISDFHETAPAYWKVLNVDWRDAAGGRLAFVFASAEKVQPYLDEEPGTYIAIYTMPSAVILGGDRNGLSRIAEKLRQEEIFTQLLPYPPIHTPCLSYLLDELQQALQDHEFKVRSPKVKLYSSITAKPYPTTEAEVRKTLMLNLDHPLRVWETLRRLYDDGARVFVQVGGGHMSAHMKQFFPTGAEVVTAALDVDTRNPITQLNHLVAGLFTAGVPMTLDPLFAHRRIQPLDLSAPRAAEPPPKMFFPLRLEWSPEFHPNVPPGTDEKPAPLALCETPPPAEATVSVPPSIETPVLHTKNATAPTPVIEPVAPVKPSTEVSPEDIIGPAVVEFDVPLPVLGTVTHYIEDRELVIERMIDVDEDLFLHDHLFVYAPYRHVKDCLPVVPLTMSLEFTAEAAALLCPGLGLIGYENVRAMRWVALEDVPRKKLTVIANAAPNDGEDGVRRIDVTLMMGETRCLSARVLFAEAYRQTMEFEWPDSSQDPPWPIPLDDLYVERRMFHGPSFHVVSGLGQFGNPVSTSWLRVLPKNKLFRNLPEPQLLVDPCLFDGVGQMAGLWCQIFDWFVLPTGVDRIELYGPTPPVGTDCELRVQITKFDMDTKQMRANIELGDGAGGVWARFEGWGDWLFRTTQKYIQFQRDPSRWSLIEPVEVPGLPDDVQIGWTTDACLSGVEMLCAQRQILEPSEFPEYEQLSGHKPRKQFLLSRIVAKDAARTWVARETGQPLAHPGQFRIGHDDRGKPYVLDLGDGPLPVITVAHKDRTVIAAAASGPIGIDLEPSGHDTVSILPTFAADAEQELLQPWMDIDPDAVWSTRLWCAKEAAGKARGTGLDGRPKRLQVVELDETGRMLIQDVDDGSVYEVQTTLVDNWVIAVALPLLETSGRTGLADSQEAEAAN